MASSDNASNASGHHGDASTGHVNVYSNTADGNYATYGNANSGNDAGYNNGYNTTAAAQYTGSTNEQAANYNTSNGEYVYKETNAYQVPQQMTGSEGVDVTGHAKELCVNKLGHTMVSPPEGLLHIPINIFKNILIMFYVYGNLLNRKVHIYMYFGNYIIIGDSNEYFSR